MSDRPEPPDRALRPPTRPYTWSAGAWFGPLLGCTLWMLVLAVMAWRLDATAGILALVAYFAANALGLLLWRRRDTLAPTPALMIQLGVTFLLALGALSVLDDRVDLHALDGSLSPRKVYGALLVYPLLMFVFWMRERAARAEAARGGDGADSDEPHQDPNARADG